MRQQLAGVLRKVQDGFQGVGSFKPRLNFPGLKQPTQTSSQHVPVAQKDDSQAENFSEAAKSAQMEFWAVVGPFVIWLITGYAEGYLFSGFRPISFTDPLSFLGYGTGFTLAAFTLNAIIKSAEHYKNRRFKACAAMVTVALMLATGSIVAQYVTLETQIITGRLDIPDSLIEHIPLFNLMIGVAGLRGHDWLFLFRSVLLLIGEFVAIYAMPSKREDIKRVYERRRDYNRMVRDLQRDEDLEKLEELIQQQTRVRVEALFQNNLLQQPDPYAVGQLQWGSPDLKIFQQHVQPGFRESVLNQKPHDTFEPLPDMQESVEKLRAFEKKEEDNIEDVATSLDLEPLKPIDISNNHNKGDAFPKN